MYYSVTYGYSDNYRSGSFFYLLYMIPDCMTETDFVYSNPSETGENRLPLTFLLLENYYSNITLVCIWKVVCGNKMVEF